MEKYGTYEVFENTDTGEIKRVPVTDPNTITKTAEKKKDWKKLDKDPKYKEE